MAIVTRNTLDGYFNTGDIPTESQYQDFIDSAASLGEVNAKTFTSATTNDFILWLKATLNDPSSHASQLFRGLILDIISTDATAWGASAYSLRTLKDSVHKFSIDVDGTVRSASTLTAAVRGMMASQFTTDTNGARLLLRKARGTEAAPTIIVSGDNLGRVVAEGYDGSSYLQMGALEFQSEGTIASTRVPTRFSIYTATDAAPSVLTERVRVGAGGRVRIGFDGNAVGNEGLVMHHSGNQSATFRATGATNYADMRLYNDQNSGSRAVAFAYTGSSWSGTFVTSGPTGEQGAMGTTGAYPFVIYTNSIARAMWDSSGNLLVGTITSPTGTNGKTITLGDNVGDPTPGTDTATIHAHAVTEIIGANVKVFATAETGDRAPLVPYKLPISLGAAATTFVADAPLIELTGDAGGNTVATITGEMAYAGSHIYILFTDSLVTLAHDNGHTANTIDLTSGAGGNFTGEDDQLIELMHDGVSWYEVGPGSAKSAAYAEIRVEQNSTATTISGTSSDFTNKVQFLGFDTDGESLNATPDHTNDHITIDVAGKYLILCPFSFSAASSDQGCSFAIFKNNGATQLGARRTESTDAGSANRLDVCTLAVIADLSANDTIELWMQNESSTANITIEDASLIVRKL